jgi:DnaK suppressor protein
VEEAMEKERLAIFKELLEERMAVLLEEAEKTANGMNNGDVFPDPTDRASLETDRNFLLRIRDRERKLILKIKEALARIEDGTFGICEECGEGISEDRLRARPVTTLCIACKTKAEEEEKKKVA